ncbi:hypothetical protein JCM19379_10550 [Methyloparacoccus murrellii]
MNRSHAPLWRGRAMIIAIALTAFVPFGLAWYYAKHPDLIDRTSNYGSLILPVRQLPLAELLPPADAPAAMAELRGRWLLLQVSTQSCAAVCAETLHKTHQGWLMLNKEMPRVRRLLLAADAEQARTSPPVRQDDALLTAGLAPSVLTALASAIGKTPDEGVVILIDPLGNLVLWYDLGFDPYQMVKDLKHLLKASQIG